MINSLNFLFLLQFRYFFRTLFIKKNSSLLITDSFNALEIKASMLFNLNFDNNTVLSCFFFFSLIIYLYFLIPTFITQIFNQIEELVILINVTSYYLVHPYNIAMMFLVIFSTYYCILLRYTLLSQLLYILHYVLENYSFYLCSL